MSYSLRYLYVFSLPRWKIHIGGTSGFSGSYKAFYPPPEKKWVSQPSQYNAGNTSDFDLLEIELINTGSKSDNGANKQSLLKAFDKLEPPFNSGSINTSFREYFLQDERMYGVYINDIQIGDVPEYVIPYVHEHIESCIGLVEIKTFLAENSEYGVRITLKFNKAPLPQTSVSLDKSENDFEFVPVKVAGVTFNNDDGESRQEYLHLIKFQRPPFTGDLDISLKQFDWKGEVAYAVYVNECQIGCVPKSQVTYIHDNFDRIIEISKINVYGGGQNKAGKDISFGAEITLKMRNIK